MRQFDVGVDLKSSFMERKLAQNTYLHKQMHVSSGGVEGCPSS